ncbi:MAG: hypothetical protein A2Z34_05345 [Planctomycetes bacterium RBG_16_59_8]|nr:MAG: hypothetical protein A2Z34_05345 [Planctomycetes bacterium RBG_16_59_8]
MQESRRRLRTTSSIIRARLGFTGSKAAAGPYARPEKDAKVSGKSASKSASSGTAARRHSIPGFSIVSKIGSGGTSIVFLAEEIHRNARKVALKVLMPQKALIPSELEKFRDEANLLIKFRHPNLVRGYHYAQYRGLHYLVLEHLNGKSVQEIIKEKGALPEMDALDIILQVSDALDYIEKQGILHRDIKPENIVVLKDGTAKLCDLGYAQKIVAGGGEEFNEVTSGTAHYMSPEQAMGKTNIDIRSDIYSLGATLYHMVMGELPYAGTDNMEVMAKHVLDALNSPLIKNKGMSRHVHYFIERMMAKDVNMRYSTPKELSEDIYEHLRGIYSIDHRQGLK